MIPFFRWICCKFGCKIQLIYHDRSYSHSFLKIYSIPYLRKLRFLMNFQQCFFLFHHNSVKNWSSFYVHFLYSIFHTFGETKILILLVHQKIWYGLPNNIKFIFLIDALEMYSFHVNYYVFFLLQMMKLKVLSFCVWLHLSMYDAKKLLYFWAKKTSRTACMAVA